MRTLKQILDGLQNAITESNIENRSVVRVVNPEWEEAKKELMKIPADLTLAVNFVKKIPQVKKQIYSRSGGVVTEYTRTIHGYDFMFEINNSIKNGITRAWLTLYDNKNSMCALRDLLNVNI